MRTIDFLSNIWHSTFGKTGGTMRHFDFVTAVETREALKNISWLQRRLLKFGKKIYIGDEGPEKHKGWSSKLPFYLFQCENCEQTAKDYPHGYLDRQYLLCLHCNTHHDFRPWWLPFQQIWNLIRIRYNTRGEAVTEETKDTDRK